MQTLQWRLKQVYGIDTMYPANDIAETICKLTGKKTLSTADIILAEKLGFKSERIM